MRVLFLSLLAVSLCACNTTRQTLPGRSAREELLISAAADRAADGLAGALSPVEGPVYLDTSYLDAPDGKYAIAAIRAAVMRRGYRLTADRPKADAIVEVRSGALSIDQHKFLIGIPEFALPIPLTGAVSIPEIALYSVHEDQGVAKFAATEFKNDQGTLITAPDPDFGYSHARKRTVMLFISWSSQDFLDEKSKDPDDAE